MVKLGVLNFIVITLVDRLAGPTSSGRLIHRLELQSYLITTFTNLKSFEATARDL